MSGARAETRLLWCLLALGGLIRVVVAFGTTGVRFDIDSYTLVAQALRTDPLHVYSVVNGGLRFDGIQGYRWPYPPGYFPIVGAARVGASHTPLPFDGLIQLPPIAADIGLAWLAHAVTLSRGGGRRLALAAAASISFGPSFAVISGYHGQLDSVAILPAACAVVLWQRPGLTHRALVCGLLIGVGASVKTVPIVMLLALLPTVKSPREAITLVVAAGAVPVMVFVPFLLADPRATFDALSYRGAPGLGGLSLVVQPALPSSWLARTSLELSPASRWLYDHGSVIPVVMLPTVGLLLRRRRVPPLAAAVVVWMAVYVALPNFFLQYLVWGLPFLVLAGRVGVALGVQAVALVPTVLVYGAPWSGGAAGPVYAAVMIALWAMWVVTLLRWCWRPPPLAGSGHRFPAGPD